MPQVQAITPDAIRVFGKIAESGSMAAATRAMNLVPFALTYRVRRLQRQLDLLLFYCSALRALDLGGPAAFARGRTCAGTVRGAG